MSDRIHSRPLFSMPLSIRMLLIVLFLLGGFSLPAQAAAPTIAVANLNYTEDQNSGNPVQMDANATAADTDDDSDWADGYLTVRITANAEAGDEISAQSVGNVGNVGNIAVDTSNGQIRHSGTHFATATDSDATVTGSATLTINFNSNATDTNVQALVQAISYRTTSDTPGTTDRTITFGLSDGTNTTQDTSTASVTANDDAPTVANAISDVTVDEDAASTTIDLSGTFTDVDNDDASITKAVQANTNASLVTPSINGNTLTLDYQADQNGTATITVRATSNGKTVDDTFTVTVNAVNDTPAFAGLDGTPTFIEGGSPVVMDGNATVSDVELDVAGNYNGATLTLARNGGANAEDQFGNSGNLGALTQGNDFTLSNVNIGTVTTNSGGTLVLSFNANATTHRADEVLQSLT